MVTAVAAILSSILDGYDFDSSLILIYAMGLIAVLTNLTAIWRVIHCYKQLQGK